MQHFILPVIKDVIHIKRVAEMVMANEAIKRLKEGNQRFASGVRSIDTIVRQIQRKDFVEGQTPFAIILGCSDSRVPAEKQSSNVLSIVNRIRPSVEPLFAIALRDDPDKLLESSIHANILAATNHLMHGSQLLESLVQQGDLKIVGAEYSLETGVVSFHE